MVTCRAFTHCARSITFSSSVTRFRLGCAALAGCSAVTMTVSNQTLFFLERHFLVVVRTVIVYVFWMKLSDCTVYPVSAVLANKDVMHVIKPGEHGSTYGGYVHLSP